jgi:LuxR family maltose regulon positive regulatory protein
VIREAKSIANKISPWYKEIIESYEAQILLDQGELELAGKLVDEGDFIRKNEHGLEFYLNKIIQFQIRVLKCEKNKEELDHVRVELLEMLDIAEAQEANFFILRILALLALIEWTGENQDAALRYLRRAFLLAEPEGYVRPFLNLGSHMIEILHYANAQGVSPRYTKRLLEAFSTEPGLKDLHTGVVETSSVDALSERELEVLRLLNTDLSTPEIANELVVAVSTVRSHVKNIYSKLNVHSRLEAIDRAKELNLV